jgi:betaine-aldehyde dehydrogenase
MSLETDILVGGVWRQGRGKRLRSINPADGSVIVELSAAGREDVDEAVAAGLRACAQPGWARLLPHERARVLHRIGDAIEADADALSALQTLDTGKTRAETRALALSAAGTFRYIAAVLETSDEVLTTPRGPYLSMSVHEPIGVVGAITPWNSPIASDAQKVAPALAAGNAVIVKPAEWTPLVSLRLGRICERQGLPPGLLSVLPGAGAEIGDAIVRHPGVGKVAFTGGTVTGRKIAVAAAEKLMPVSLELGGKSPTVVFEDADREHALAGVLFGIFSSSGQSCIAGSRLFVQSSIYEQFVTELLERARALPLGPPDDPATRVAPMVSFEHRDKVAQRVACAVTAGARVLCGGSVPSGAPYDRGAYYPPTILAGVDNNAGICREEIFGPVLVVLPFNDEDDLIEQANDSVYGLACGLWTRDFQRAYRIARAISAGTVWINTYKQLSIATPFGGFRDSGIGREKGREAIRAYMQQKSLYWSLSPEPIRWAAASLTEPT